MSAALFYHPEAYTTSGPKLMGRHAAGESFLRGYLQHSPAPEFFVQVHERDHAQAFAVRARALGREEPIHVVQRDNLSALARAAAVYHPGPGICTHAWQRAAFGHTAWSLCGITHTTSSAGAMDAIVELLTAPVQPWDALICTSTAVRDHVQRLLQAQVDHLQQRLGITRVVLPAMPVIPLGIHTQDFAFSADQRAQARQALGVAESALVVLFMGRLSFHAKAHPLAMYQALARAQQATGREVVLVECGWHANEFIQKAYAEAAQAACPGVRVVTLDGRSAEARQTAWAGADVFCSLSDNIQETFGITPIEAMAAGLPVVVSDWDGYKDTVRHGVDGYRIPTLMPQPGLAHDLAMRHALELDSYDLYCGHSCLLVAVDIDAAAQAFTQLFQNPALRQQMGQAGRARAQEVYDWKTVIGQYEALWAELRERRLAAGKATPTMAQARPHPWPARLEPLHGFAAYPSQTLGLQTRLQPAAPYPSAADMMEAERRWRRLAMVQFGERVMLSKEDTQTLLRQAAQGPQTAAQLLSALPEPLQARGLRALAVLLKLGILAAPHP